MVSYKKTATYCEAFNAMPHHQLIVAGTGPEFAAIQNSKSIFNLWVCRSRATQTFAKCESICFFTTKKILVLCRARACGTPVIAFGRGVLETVVQEQTGLFFQEQTTESYKLRLTYLKYKIRCPKPFGSMLKNSQRTF
jgi:glycosyltransferase involved in cell wall biosynthesis